MRDGDEFDRAELVDHELDLAADHELAALDWLELHGEPIVSPTLDEAIRQEGKSKRDAWRPSS